MRVIPGLYRQTENGVYVSTHNIVGVAVHTENRTAHMLFQTMDPFHGDLSHMPLKQFTDGLDAKYCLERTNPAPLLVPPLLRLFELRPGLYEHMKGGRYNVLGVSTDESTGEKMAAYQPLYGAHRFAFCLRPLAMFREYARRPGLSYSVPRFFLIDPYHCPHIAAEYQD